MKILSYLLSSVFALYFYSLLLIFHVIQWLGKNLFGYKGHKAAVDLMNFCLTKSTLILGVRTIFEDNTNLKENQTYIFVANHQSMLDVPPLSWHLRKFHPKFVSKIELAKGTPSVSYNLRHGGSVLIDRKNGSSALHELENFGKKINTNKWSAIIFPEGTRSRTGIPKDFSSNGLKVLTQENPNAFVVPITINNSWAIFKYGKFPLGLFKPMIFKIHQPIKIDSMPFEQLLKLTESTIKNDISFVADSK